MQKFEKTLRFGSEIKLTLGGDCIVTFVKSNDDNDFVRVKYPLNSTPITMDVSEESVVITNHDKVSVNDSDFKNFKDSIVNKKGVANAITNFLSDALSFKNKIETNKVEIFVEISLRDVEMKKSIYLNAENLKINFHHVSLNEVLINAGNLTVNQGNLTSNSLKIKSGNLKADLFFNEDNRRINVKSANAKICLNKRPEFNGLVTASGNNIKIDSSLRSGSKDVGELNAKLNNGSIKLNE
jgi:hypothetical protein